MSRIEEIMLEIHTQNILQNTDYDTNCRGLQAKDSAIAIVEHHFNNEGLSFNEWHVTEIPLIDNSGKYPTAIVIIVYNSNLKYDLSLCLSNTGNLVCCIPADMDELECKSIQEALNHLN